MKKILFTVAIFSFFIVQSNAQHADNHPVIADNGKKIEGGIQWITWEQATELNKTKPKKFMIDVYTEWCGWCKKNG
jgi:thiol:disulfide interchange protein